MFYCDDCAEERGWPRTPFTSQGMCECCGLPRRCYDLPSSELPPPRAGQERES